MHIDIKVIYDANHRVPVASRKGRGVFNYLIKLMIIVKRVARGKVSSQESCRAGKRSASRHQHYSSVRSRVVGGVPGA